MATQPRRLFLARHHKRSNVETTFSMIKTKFRDHVGSMAEAAAIKHVLCKIICHNICCPIQESHELGNTLGGMMAADPSEFKFRVVGGGRA
jgi:hypothetical protein